MDVDIDIFEGQIQKQYNRRILPFHQKIFVSLENRMGEYFVAHVASVHIGVKIARVGKRGWCRAQKAVHGKLAKRYDVLDHLAPQHLLQTIARLPDGGIIRNRTGIVLQAKMNRRMSERDPIDDIADMAQFRRRRFEELATRGHVKKDIADDDRRS